MTFKKELYHCPEKNFFKQNKFYNSVDKILLIIHTLAHNTPKQEHGYTDTNTHTVV